VKVVLTADAKRSLARTIRTLARIYSKGYLTKLKKQVDEQVDWLADHPLAGAFEPELEQLGQGHRRWVVGPIKLVYRVTGGTILVTDIFDSRRDPQRMKG
jgi:plasmid stabilization system protein ParE